MAEDKQPRLSVELLGPVRVWLDGEQVGPAGQKRRGLFAVLAVQANGVVSTDDLIDRLWGEHPPGSAINLVQTYVSAWRRALEPSRRPRGGGGRLQTVGVGYELLLAPDESDLLRFEAHIDRSTSHDSQGNAAESLVELDRALRLWRGPALADLVGLPFATNAARRLENRRLDMVETWALLKLGSREPAGITEVIERLEQARASEPLRERLSELSMWALCRAGRPAEALLMYERVRRVLATELGADPGAALREMHARVLGDDQELRPIPTRIDLGAAGHPRRPPWLTVPVRLDSFVGRGEELREVRKLLADKRLVTLTGAGGSGKTRLAEQLANETGEGFPDGVAMVELADLRDPAQVPAAIAAAIGAPIQPSEDALDRVIEHLAARDFLLVVDNLEHLPGAAAIIDRLHRESQRLRLLCTSRHPLELEGEQRCTLRPLAVPAETDGQNESLWAFDAVRLFVDRVKAVDRSFELTAANGQEVARIVRHLDGLPLAMEIAAPWLPVLGVAQLRERLIEQAPLVNRGGDAAPRHQTMQATVDWSYRLLSDDQQRLLNGLAVFRRSASLPAIDAVCGADLGRPVLSLLAELCEHNLVTPLPGPGPSRFRLLETVREFAAERLSSSGQEDAALERHAHWYTAWAARLSAHSEGPGSADWRAQAALDAENLRLAMDRLSSRPSEALQFVSDCMVLWHELGHTSEGIRRLDAALARAAEADPARSIATANLAWLESVTDTGRAARDARVAIDLAQKSGDVLVEAFAWQTLALAADDIQDTYEALDRAIKLAAQGQDRPVRDAATSPHAVQAGAGHDLGVVSLFRDSKRAVSAFRETREVNEIYGDRESSLVNTALLGLALLLAGHVAEADRELDSCHADLTDLSSWSTTRAVWVAQARLAFTQGRWDEAVEKYEAVFRASAAGGTLQLALISGTALADVLMDRGRNAEAHSVLAELRDVASAAPDDFKASLWVRRAREHRHRGELAEAQQLLEHAESALPADGLFPEQVVWFVEQFALAKLRGDAPAAEAFLDRLNQRAFTTGLVIPPWELRQLALVGANVGAAEPAPTQD